MKKKFKTVGVGGTFDEFHRGHRALLLKAFEVGKHVQIGLCTDEFAKQIRKNHPVASFEERLEELEAFLNHLGVLDRAEVIPLADAHGPAVASTGLEAIVVSQETEPVAHEINEERERRGLPPLEVIAINMVPAENHVSISTTRIRRGEIDKEGHVLDR